MDVALDKATNVDVIAAHDWICSGWSCMRRWCEDDRGISISVSLSEVSDMSSGGVCTEAAAEDDEELRSMSRRG